MCQACVPYRHSVVTIASFFFGDWSAAARQYGDSIPAAEAARNWRRFGTSGLRRGKSAAGDAIINDALPIRNDEPRGRTYNSLNGPEREKTMLRLACLGVAILGL